MSTKPKVVVSETLSDKALGWLKQRAEVIRTTPEDVYDVIGDADGLCVRTYTLVDEKLLDKAPELKVVGRAGVALDNIKVPLCRSRGVEVVHTPAANTLAVVDYTMHAIIAMNRRFWPISGYMEPEQFHKTRKQTFGHFLAERTLGIIGVGRIGSRVGRAAAGLGMKVLTNDIRDVELDYPHEKVDKETLFAQSDIVTIHVPVTDLTRKFINAETLSQFKDGAQFINAARGQCVDYSALAEALKSNKLDWATIDCHHPEPPPKDYPLFGLDNVTLTPHVAARVPKAMENMSDVVFDIIKVIEGEKPEYAAQEGAF